MSPSHRADLCDGLLLSLNLLLTPLLHMFLFPLMLFILFFLQIKYNSITSNIIACIPYAVIFPTITFHGKALGNLLVKRTCQNI